MAGLLVNAGVGMLVLFRMNDHVKDNIAIVAIVYGIGVLSGLILTIFMS
jgi:acyl transferase domain-containing protein